MQYPQNQDGFTLRRSVLVSGLLLLLALTGLAVPMSAFAANETPARNKEEKKEDSASDGGTKTRRRDPFVVPGRVKREPPKPKVSKDPQPIMIPGIEMRMTEYRNQVRQASLSNRQGPGSLSPYLIEELTINGIFKTSEGFGAFVVEGVSSKRMTLFARPGMKTYDGVVSEVTPEGVRFVRHIRYDNGTTLQRELFVPLGRNARPTSAAPVPAEAQPKEPADKAKAEGRPRE